MGVNLSLYCHLDLDVDVDIDLDVLVHDTFYEGILMAWAARLSGLPKARSVATKAMAAASRK